MSGMLGTWASFQEALPDRPVETGVALSQRRRGQNRYLMDVSFWPGLSEDVRLSMDHSQLVSGFFAGVFLCTDHLQGGSNLLALQFTILRLLSIEHTTLGGAAIFRRMQRFYDTPFGHYGRRMDGLYDLVDPRGSFPEVDRNSTARGDDRNRQSVFSPYESMAWPSTASVGNSMEPNDQYVSGLCYLADYRGSLPEADYNATVHGNNLNGQPVSLPYEHIAESSTASFGNGMYPNANSIVIQYRVPLTAAVPGPEPDFQPYFLERENGQFTRLIPADTLPPLNEVPPREVSTKGHYVLPTLSPRERRVTLKVGNYRQTTAMQLSTDS